MPGAPRKGLVLKVGAESERKANTPFSVCVRACVYAWGQGDKYAGRVRMFNNPKLRVPRRKT